MEEEESKKEITFLVTNRGPLDVIHIHKDGVQILELVVVSLSKDRVKLAIKADKSLRYYLSSAKEGLN